MQGLPIQVDHIKEQMLEMSLDKSSRDIAKELTMPIRDVLEFLSTPEAINYREIKLKMINDEVQYKRLTRANEIVEQFMDGVEKLSRLDPTKWKIQHVKLFELMLKDIPEQLKNLKQINNLQINNYNQSSEDSKMEESLENKMESLPAELRIRFWQEVEMLAEKYVEDYREKNSQRVYEVPENTGVNDGSGS